MYNTRGERQKKLSPCVRYILFAFFWYRHGPVSGEGKKEENRTGGRGGTCAQAKSKKKKYVLVPVFVSFVRVGHERFKVAQVRRQNPKKKYVM
jgi:hypothetical protein